MKSSSDKEIKWIPFALVLFAAILVNRVSTRSDWVESWYSNGLYPYIGSFFRFVFGWLPISFGDVLYLLSGIWILYKLIRLIRVVRTKSFNRNSFVAGVFSYSTIALAVYLFFNLFWGLNYNRQGIASQLELNVKERPVEELKSLVSDLLEQTNRYSQPSKWKQSMKNDELFAGAVDTYHIVSKNYAFLKYRPESVKASLFGIAGNYIGYTGYFNPFTSEAQINDKVPMAVQPFVTCHEIAHQLGYAKENEANFVGYLAAVSSTDTAFRYSASFEMFLYANAELFLSDSTTARNNYSLLSPAAKADLAALRAFRIKYENPLDKAVDIFYDRYLRLNQQPAGTRSYSRVVAWLLAWKEKSTNVDFRGTK